MDIRAAIKLRLAHLDLPANITTLLTQVVVDDVTRLEGRIEVGSVISRVADLLLDNGAAAVAPFRAAWLVMYAAIQRLDHLQDGDIEEAPLQFLPSTPARYNFTLGCYLLGSSLLDELKNGFTLDRVEQVRRLWNDMMLRMAMGQQLDLHAQGEVPSVAADAYQSLVRAKTGATYMLAFAAPAVLFGANADIVRAFALVGEIYGTLLQFFDDVRDAAEQSKGATLSKALCAGFNVAPEQMPALLHGYIYPAYRTAALQAVEHLPSAIQAGIQSIFADAFDASSTDTI